MDETWTAQPLRVVRPAVHMETLTGSFAIAINRSYNTVGGLQDACACRPEYNSWSDQEFFVSLLSMDQFESLPQSGLATYDQGISWDPSSIAQAGLFRPLEERRLACHLVRSGRRSGRVLGGSQRDCATVEGRGVRFPYMRNVGALGGQRAQEESDRGGLKGKDGMRKRCRRKPRVCSRRMTDIDDVAFRQVFGYTTLRRAA